MPQELVHLPISTLGDLTTQIATGQHEDQTINRIAHIAQRIDTCNGTSPKQLREYLHEVGGYLNDGLTNIQVITLAKACSSGELLQEIRTITSRATEPATTWETTEAELRTTFIPAADTLKLKHRFSHYKQLHSESTPNYIRRFKIDKNDAYGTTVTGSDVTHLIGCFLRGLTDRTMARKICLQNKTTLEETLQTTQQFADNSDKLYHLFLRPGEEPMDITVVGQNLPDPPFPPNTHHNDDNNPRSEVQKLTAQIAALSTIVKKKFDTNKPPSQPQQTTQKSQNYTQNNRNTRNDQNPQRYSSTHSKPMFQDTRRCFECNQLGHLKRDCQRLKRSPRYDTRQATRTVTTCFKCGKRGHFANECYTQTAHINVRHSKNWSAP